MIDQINKLPKDGLKSSPETSRYTENKWISRKNQNKLYFLHLIEKRKLSYDIKKSQEAKQKCNEQLQRKAAEYDSQIFHLEEQLRKQ